MGRGQGPGHEPRRAIAPTRSLPAPRPGLVRTAAAPLRSGGGSWQPGRGPGRPTGASGDRLGRRPAGGVSRTATQVPAAAGADNAGVRPATVAQVKADLQGISPVERNWSDRGLAARRSCRSPRSYKKPACPYLLNTRASQHVFRIVRARDRGARRAGVDHVGNYSFPLHRDASKPAKFMASGGGAPGGASPPVMPRKSAAAALRPVGKVATTSRHLRRFRR